MVLLVLFAAGCTGSDTQSVGGDGSAVGADIVPTVVTLLDRGELISWEANAGPSDTNLDLFAEWDLLADGDY